MARFSSHGGPAACVGLLVVLGFAAALSTLGAQTSSEEPPVGAAAGARVAVVDMAVVRRESAEWRDSAEARSRMLDTRNRTLSKLSRQVQLARNEFENLPPGTEERRAKGLELEEALRQLQQQQLQFDEQMARQFSDSIRSLFARLTQVVRDYARENGIGVVLKKQDLELTGPDTVELGLQIATTEVLYADPALDITEAVVERLNAQYAGPIEVK